MVSMSKQGIEIRRRYSMKCDAAAFAGMYETIYKDLYRYALCMMRNPHDAEDVVSETVIKGMRGYIRCAAKMRSKAGCLRYCQMCASTN